MNIIFTTESLHCTHVQRFHAQCKNITSNIIMDEFCYIIQLLYIVEEQMGKVLMHVLYKEA